MILDQNTVSEILIPFYILVIVKVISLIFYNVLEFQLLV